MDIERDPIASEKSGLPPVWAFSSRDFAVRPAEPDRTNARIGAVPIVDALAAPKAGSGVARIGHRETAVAEISANAGHTDAEITSQTVFTLAIEARSALALIEIDVAIRSPQTTRTPKCVGVAAILNELRCAASRAVRCIAVCPGPAFVTSARVAVHPIGALTMSARIRCTLVDVDVAVRPGKARAATASVSVDQIIAVTMHARARRAFVDVDFAVRPGKARSAFTNVAVDAVETSAVDTGIRHAFVRLVLAVRPGVTRRATARITTRIAHTRAAVLARAWRAMIGNVRCTCAVGARKTVATRQRRVTRRSLGQTAPALTIRIVDRHIIARMPRMRIDTRRFADLENRKRLRRRRRAMANLHLTIDRKVIALRRSQRLIGCSNMLVLLSGRRRGCTTSTHRIERSDEREHSAKYFF